MNKILLSAMLAAAAATPAIAGVNNLNYQAVIKNGTEAVKDQKVEMKFEIVDNSNTVLYTEEQAPKTDAAGLVTCQLGGEALETLDWGDVKLRVSVNLGSGYEVVSDAPVNAVPASMYALRSADTDELKVAVEEMLLEFEDVKANVRSMGADVAQIEGLATEVETNVEAIANLEELTGETGRIMTAIKANENNIATNIEAITNLENELDDTAWIKSSIRTLQGEVKANQADYQEDFQKMTEFQDGASTAINELMPLVEEFDELKSTVLLMGADVAQIEGLAENVETNIEAITNLENELDDTSWIKSSIRTLQGEVKENQATYQEDFQKMVEFQEGVTGKFAEMDETFQGIVDFQDGASTAINELMPLVQEVDELNKTVTTMGADVARIEGLSEDIEANTEDIKNIYEIVGETGSLTQSVKDLQGKQAKDAADIKDLQENWNDETYQGLATFQDGVTSTLAELEPLVQEVDDLNKKVTTLTADVTRIDGLAEEIETNTEAIANLEELTGETGRIMYLINQLQAKVASLEAEVKALKGE